MQDSQKEEQSLGKGSGKAQNFSKADQQKESTPEKQANNGEDAEQQNGQAQVVCGNVTAADDSTAQDNGEKAEQQQQPAKPAASTAQDNGEKTNQE